jgi:hypothetical protein
MVTVYRGEIPSRENTAAFAGDLPALEFVAAANLRL